MTSGLQFQTTDGPCFTAEMMETSIMSDHKSGAAPGTSPSPQGSLADLSQRAWTEIQNTQPAQISSPAASSSRNNKLFSRQVQTF